MKQLLDRYPYGSLGLFFTTGSLFLTWTIVAPIFAVLPGMLPEVFLSLFFTTGRGTGIVMMTLLSILAIFLIWDAVKGERNATVTIRSRVLTFILLYFTLQPLGFYLYMGERMYTDSDGQFIFGTAESSFYTSFAFLPIGIILELIRKRTQL